MKSPRQFDERPVEVDQWVILLAKPEGLDLPDEDAVISAIVARPGDALDPHDTVFDPGNSAGVYFVGDAFEPWVSKRGLARKLLSEKRLAAREDVDCKRICMCQDVVTLEVDVDAGENERWIERE